jgi:hypothetical protein
MRSLSYTAEGALVLEDPGAWSFYIAFKYNPDKNKEIVAIMSDEQRQALRNAYDIDENRRRENVVNV